MSSLGGRGREEVFKRAKDEDGMILGKEELVIDRWNRYFTGLYSGTREDVKNSRVGVSVMEETEEIELEEMVRELRKTKIGESPGVCENYVELLKAGGMS